jgi:arginyl-tRNA synthetase
MKSVLEILEERITAVMADLAGGEACAAIVKPAKDPKFGDYQANGVMALARKLKTNPRNLAEQVLEKLDLRDICEPPEVAGPGFINLRLKPDFLADRLLEINKASADLGIQKTEKPKTIVVDFSSPNIAKQMHVGHLRSTIIGDSICRILEALGHEVIRQNHIGDWGTQFGMLIAMYDEMYKKGTPRLSDETPRHIKIGIFEDAYRIAKYKYDNDPIFAQTSREWVVKLQNHDPDAICLWKDVVDASLAECQQLYDYLRTILGPEHVKGESSYNDSLSEVVEELKKAGLAKESDGAMCIFPNDFKNKEGEPLPVIIRKSDGAYLYATTDLAALRYRVNELKADAIVYVTDARQKLHFEMLFAVARMAGWAPEDVELTHVMFGSVLGEDGAPLKTRSGENFKLKDLLDEAVERAKAVVEEKNPDLPAEKKAQIAKAVGIGAVKYADYSNNRTSDYVFSFDKMLAMDGNTAPYMQYAYARIKSIERKAQGKDLDIEAELAAVKTISLAEPSEVDLAKHLIRYGQAIQAAAADYRPNYLTMYLYELAQKFSAFYTNCPVLSAGPDQRPTRLLLCDLTARTIKHGLQELLGIEVVEQM